MTAYQKAVELGLTGSDAEIVAVLQTLGARDVPVLEVATWLRERGLLVVGFRGTTGSLVAFYDQCSDSTIKAGLDEFFASVVGRQAATVRFTDPQIAGRVYSIATQLLPQIGGDAAMLESFYAMTGGLPYANLTVEQFAAERTEAQAVKVDPEWTDQSVLLSVNLGPQNQSVMLRVSHCAVAAGAVVNGPVIATVASVQAADDPRFAGLLTEIRKLTEALSNG